MSALHLTGTLTDDARLCVVGANGSAWLLLSIGQGQPPRPTQALARWHIGTGLAAQYLASTAARRYRRGCRVCVYAQSYEVMLSPTPHIVLMGIDHVFSLDLPAPRHEARDTTF
jgi:hypothetical protein